MALFAGIDIGGTKIAFGLLLDEGIAVRAGQIPTRPQDGFDAIAMKVIDGIDQMLASAGLARADLAGIGIGCPGPLDEKTGTILHDPTLGGWKGQCITAPFDEAFGSSGRPVGVINDADAAILGECWIGAGKGASEVVMFTFGTGVGGAVMAGGRLLRGAGGEHPELGHIPVDPAGPACYCGLCGCLESLASGTAVDAAAKAAGFSGARELLASAAAGRLEPAAADIVNRTAVAIAGGVAAVTHAFLPEAIILGGGLMQDHYGLLAAASSEMLQRLSLASHKPPRLAKAGLGSGAGVAGAAFFARERAAERSV